MMAFKLLRKKLNSCLGNYSYEEMTVRFFYTILNWPLILISWSYHENRKQATCLRNSHATHHLARMASKVWIILSSFSCFAFSSDSNFCKCARESGKRMTKIKFSFLQIATKQREIRDEFNRCKKAPKFDLRNEKINRGAPIWAIFLRTWRTWKQCDKITQFSLSSINYKNRENCLRFFKFLKANCIWFLSTKRKIFPLNAN